MRVSVVVDEFARTSVEDCIQQIVDRLKLSHKQLEKDDETTPLKRRISELESENKQLKSLVMESKASFDPRCLVDLVDSQFYQETFWILKFLCEVILVAYVFVG